MRLLILAFLLAACGGGGGSSPHGAVVLQDEFCALRTGFEFVPAYVRTQYEDGTVIVADEWGLEEEGFDRSIAWNSLWQAMGGVLGECQEESVSRAEVEAEIVGGGFAQVTDYSTGASIFFDDVQDFRDFLANR